MKKSLPCCFMGMKVSQPLLFHRFTNLGKPRKHYRLRFLACFFRLKITHLLEVQLWVWQRSCMPRQSMEGGRGLSRRIWSRQRVMMTWRLNFLPMWQRWCLVPVSVMSMGSGKELWPDAAEYLGITSMLCQLFCSSCLFHSRVFLSLFMLNFLQLLIFSLFLAIQILYFPFVYKRKKNLESPLIFGEYLWVSSMVREFNMELMGFLRPRICQWLSNDWKFGMDLLDNFNRRRFNSELNWAAPADLPPLFPSLITL